MADGGSACRWMTVWTQCKQTSAQRERIERFIHLNLAINMKILTFIQSWLDCLLNQTQSVGFFFLITINSIQTAWIDDQIDLAHIFHLFFSTRSLIPCDNSGEIFLHASEFISAAVISGGSQTGGPEPTTRALINEHQMLHRWEMCSL